MANIIDLTGQKFGRLLVIERANRPENIKNKGTYWFCICDCGKNILTSSSSLRTGNAKSCGCYNKEMTSKTNTLNIEGQRFGKLIAIRMMDEIKNGGHLWMCKCDCGNEIIVKLGSLRQGCTKSCGCLRRSKIPYGESSRKEIYESYKIRAKNKKIEFDIDIDFFTKITKDNCFYCGAEPKNMKISKINNGNFVYNGIDRLDSSRGYLENNCVPCCAQCNRSKSYYSKHIFLSWIKDVYEYSIKNNIDI